VGAKMGLPDLMHVGSAMTMSRDSAFTQAAAGLGVHFDGEIKLGGNYVALARDGRHVYVSGQVPRVGSEVVVTGRAGGDVTLAQAQFAAQVCALRALALLQRSLGSLDPVRAILKVNVFTQAADGFTQLSEVADAASALLHEVLGPQAGAHARTSVGVFQLPKNATVELDLVAVVD
jgi:enamine deaminase RidA (YjgF/YER057c/UK114 family)